MLQQHGATAGGEGGGLRSRRSRRGGRLLCASCIAGVAESAPLPSQRVIAYVAPAYRGPSLTREQLSNGGQAGAASSRPVRARLRNHVFWLRLHGRI